MLSRLRYAGKAIGCIAARRTPNLVSIAPRGLFTQLKPVHISKLLNSPVRCFSSYPSHKVLNLPNLSPTMTKGNITKWYKKEGDTVAPGDIICDVETDKATVGYEMVEDGVIARILVPEGTNDVPLGTPVAVMVEEAKDVAAFKDFKAAAGPAPKPKEAAKEEVQDKKETTERRSTREGEKMRASPAAKKLAAENNVDLSKIEGTGPNGRILREDVVAYMSKKSESKTEERTEEKPAAAAKKSAPTGKRPPEIPGMPEFTDIELTKYKRVTAERLTEAKQTVPHFYVSVECEVDKLLTLRTQLNKEASSKISINDMLIKACAAACLKVPASNSSWMGDCIRAYKDVDMSVAVQTPSGLITPIVPRANRLGMGEIAKLTKALIEKAKQNTLKPEEFIGGTFTISNAGMYGISQLIPIVNPPQACILGVSGVEKKIVLDERMPEGLYPPPLRVSSRIMVSLSCDHRVVDGAAGAEWTREFKKVVENPALLML